MSRSKRQENKTNQNVLQSLPTPESKELKKKMFYPSNNQPSRKPARIKRLTNNVQTQVAQASSLSPSPFYPASTSSKQHTTHRANSPIHATQLTTHTSTSQTSIISARPDHHPSTPKMCFIHITTCRTCPYSSPLHIHYTRCPHAATHSLDPTLCPNRMKRRHYSTGKLCGERNDSARRSSLSDMPRRGAMYIREKEVNLRSVSVGEKNGGVGMRRRSERLRKKLVGRTRCRED